MQPGSAKSRRCFDAGCILPNGSGQYAKASDRRSKCGYSSGVTQLPRKVSCHWQNVEDAAVMVTIAIKTQPGPVSWTGAMAVGGMVKSAWLTHLFFVSDVVVMDTTRTRTLPDRA